MVRQLRLRGITLTARAGIVRDWEDMRHVWNHTFYDKLKIDPKHSKARCAALALLAHNASDFADGGGDEPQGQPPEAGAGDV